MAVYAYLVKGSEDGVFSVCGNKKRAFEKAVSYVSEKNEPYDEDVKIESASNFYWSFEADNSSTDAWVEKFVLE